MMRKVLAGLLIGVSSIFLLSSLAGAILAWVYNEPLTVEVTNRLTEIETQLAQVQSDLRLAKAEVERALRMIHSAEDALTSLSETATSAKDALDEVDQTLDEELMPGLEDARARIIEVRAVLVDLLNTVSQLNSLPFINLNIPGGDLLAEILSGVDSLDTDIAVLQEVAGQASVFISDVSYLIGGDFQTAKQNLQDLLEVLEGYDSELTAWLAQVRTLKDSAPGWIDSASLSLSVVLSWFAFSQLGLILHGLAIWRGKNPWEGWRLGKGGME